MVAGHPLTPRARRADRRQAGEVVPPRGFEPLISTLKGWRPRPLDDGGQGRPSVAGDALRLSSARAREHEQDDRTSEASCGDHGGDAADDAEHDRPATTA